MKELLRSGVVTVAAVLPTSLQAYDLVVVDSPVTAPVVLGDNAAAEVSADVDGNSRVDGLTVNGVQAIGDIEIGYIRIGSSANIGATESGLFIGAGSRVVDGISNAGLIGNEGAMDADAGGSAIAIAGDVDGGVVNSGRLHTVAHGCDGAVCVGNNGIFAYGPAEINGGISNSGDIEVTNVGIRLMASQNTTGDEDLGRPSLAGGIINTGSIRSNNHGIGLHGALVQGDILNSATGTIVSDASSGLRLDRSAALGDPSSDDVVGLNLNGTHAARLDGNIINEGVIAGWSGGVVLKGQDVFARELLNSGTIESTGSGEVEWALDVREGAALEGIRNSADGLIQGLVGGIRLNDASISGGIDNEGVVCALATGEQEISSCSQSRAAATAIDIRGESQVGGIRNSGQITGGRGIVIADGAQVSGGVINEGGIGAADTALLIDGGELDFLDNRKKLSEAGGLGAPLNAVLVQNGGRLGEIRNSGTIQGLVDFGSAGGVYRFQGGEQLGAIRGLTGLSIEPGSGSGQTLSVLASDLTYGGVLSVALEGQSSGTRYGTLSVSGAVDLDGSEVQVSVTGEEFLAAGQRYTIVESTQSLSAEGVSLSDNSALLSFALEQEQSAEFSRLLLEVERTSLGELALQAGVDPNSAGFKNVAEVFQVLAGDVAEGIGSGEIPADSELAQFYAAVMGLSDGREAYLALKSLQPEASGASAAGSQEVDSAAASTVNRRVAALRGNHYGVPAGDVPVNHGLWLQGYLNDTEQDDRDGVNGFDADTSGFALGYDRALDAQKTVGAAFSWAATDVDSDGPESNSLDIDSYRLTLYGSYNAERYFVDTQLAYAYNQYDNVRNIQAGDYRAQALSDHSGDQFSLRLRGGYPMAFSNGLYLTPRSSLEYTYLNEEDYRETGAGNLGLEVSTDAVEVLLMRLGTKMAYPITTESEFTWVPELSVDVTHDFIGDEVEIDSNFLGVAAAAFATQGANVEQTGVVTGFRIRAFSQGNFSFSGGFDYLYKKDYSSQSWNATLRYDF